MRSERGANVSSLPQRTACRAAPRYGILRMAELTLYNYWRSSSSYRVRIALALKGLDYEYVAIDLLADEQSGGAFRTRSPAGYVPCLTIDGVDYVESVAIVELLEERFPSPPLYPKDAHGRARVRALVETVNSGIQPLHNRSALQFLSPQAEGQKAWLRHFVPRGLATLEALLARIELEGVRGAFAFGEVPTAADVFLVPQVFAARRFQVDLAPYRRLVRAYDAAMQLDAFQKAHPDRQPDAVKK
jgi:maleylpyruvate isomerase